MSVIVRPIVSAITGVVNLLFSWIVKSILFLLVSILDKIFTIFGTFVMPDFVNYSQYVVAFWDKCFEFIGWLRSAFLIDKMSMQLILIILTIKLTYKPLIALVKMFIHWYDKLKP